VLIESNVLVRDTRPREIAVTKATNKTAPTIDPMTMPAMAPLDRESEESESTITSTTPVEEEGSITTELLENDCCDDEDSVAIVAEDELLLGCTELDRSGLTELLEAGTGKTLELEEATLTDELDSAASAVEDESRGSTTDELSKSVLPVELEAEVSAGSDVRELPVEPSTADDESMADDESGLPEVSDAPELDNEGLDESPEVDVITVLDNELDSDPVDDSSILAAEDDDLTSDALELC